MTDNELETRMALKLGIHDKAARKLYLAAALAALRPEERPYLAAMDAAAMQSLDRALSTLAVAECNRELTAREIKRRDTLKARVGKLAAIYGLGASFGLSGFCLFGEPLARLKGNPDEIQVA